MSNFTFEPQAFALISKPNEDGFNCPFCKAKLSVDDVGGNLYCSFDRPNHNFTLYNEGPNYKDIIHFYYFSFYLKTSECHYWFMFNFKDNYLDLYIEDLDFNIIYNDRLDDYGFKDFNSIIDLMDTYLLFR